jgi:tripartite-type tricarboxylate transporter receptor subunit TctC
VRLVVPFPPGSLSDIAARLTDQWLSERLGRPFIIDNRPRAGSKLGTEAAVNASADGYTLLLVASPNAINATLYEKLNFNFIRDIAPVASGCLPDDTEVNPVAYAGAHPGHGQNGFKRHRNRVTRSC